MRTNNVRRESRRQVENSKRDIGAMAVLALLFGTLDVILGLGSEATTGWAGPYAGLGLQLLVDASLLFLIRFPRAVTLFALVISLVMLASEVWAPGLFVPVESVSPAAVPRATPAILIAIVINLDVDRRWAFTMVGIFAVLAARPWDASWSVTPFGLLSTAGAALTALYFDARKQLLQSLRDRAERAEREQFLLAEKARFEERRRLAAEMHDVVTHRLSLMVLHAGALRLTSKDDATRRAAEDIRAAGTQALNELRDLVGVLRNSPPEATIDGARPADPRQSLPNPATLIHESESVGVPVDLSLEGEPSQVSPTVARTAYRIIQEALTNVRKHAAGATVRVELHYRPEGVSLLVDNTAPTRPADPILTGSGSGTGLSGLRQRVELIGGSLAANPTSDGGYRLSAILPAYVPTAESREDDSVGRRR